MNYKTIKTVYRQLAKNHRVYKFSVSESWYNRFSKLCDKYKINMIDYLTYWNSDKFFYPSQLLSLYYIKTYLNKAVIHTKKELPIYIHDVLVYKWLNGKLVDELEPLDQFIAFTKSLDATAKKYSLIYLITHKDILTFVSKYFDEDSEVSNMLTRIKLPYSFAVYTNDNILQYLSYLQDNIKKMQQYTLIELSELDKILLFGGETP